MCGIAGVVRLNSRKPIEQSVVADMANCMVHRGPDDAGLVVEQNVGFGFRRLSIIDVSSGHQPMWDTGNRACIVFNGEVYNYREIREVLAGAGRTFATKSDTEVVLTSYLHWGPSCLSRFIGMFAFALFDREKNRCWIVRDRLGIKPLYYAMVDDSLVFASEPKGILHYPGFQPRPNLEAVWAYFGYRFVPGSRTLYENIRSLEPGTYLDIDLTKGTVSQHQYWDLPIVPTASKEHTDPRVVKQTVRSLIESAVDYRLIADVPVGAYLSGGLDSSIVVSLMQQRQKKQVATFSITYRESDFDESAYAWEVAKFTGTDHHEICVDPGQYLEAMKAVTRFKDAPVSVPNEVPIYLMSRELKKYITVVLSGEGADELFGGYGRIFRSPFDRLRQSLNEPALRSLFPPVEGVEPEHEFFLRKYAYTPRETLRYLFAPGARESAAEGRMYEEFFRNHFARLEGLDLYDKFLWIFQKIHLVGLLQRLDTATMGVSVEGRVPFVDHRLVEYVNALPFSYKIRWKDEESLLRAVFKKSDEISEVYDEPKWLLRSTFSGDIPSSVLQRKKVGFPVPLKHWIHNETFNERLDRLSRGAAVEMKILSSEGIEKLKASFNADRSQKTALQLWMVLSLDLWLGEYFS